MRRLRGEVAKAEAVRRALLQSLGEEHVPKTAAASAMNAGGAAGAAEGDGGGGRRNNNGSSSNISHDLRGYYTPGVLGARAKNAASDNAAAFAAGGENTDDGVGGDSNVSTRIPASWQKPSTSSFSSTPTTSTTTMTGKEFFRAARARLPAARFEDLMAAVRALNGGRASRTSALAAAAEALGGEGGGCCADLVPVFEGLLSQRVPVD